MGGAALISVPLVLWSENAPTTLGQGGAAQQRGGVAVLSRIVTARLV